ncbi:hypothetical protein Q0Z83_053530 [Actinoplanes sichuanensis]|uniref:Lipoprotein n=1 Tax=Actinoplanes sichuanensis TaxID=512349 RepID=A0ABW4AS97_9ACTN|nr:hypothetical protein [Actinoplanes sichuanensis]BEL07162.1 hypothetical protein Q0Z83_053530 [Actinoplanes sichuanensis]
MKRFVAGAVASITALTLTVGCANQIQQLEPKLELKKAAEDLGAAEKVGFTIKAGGSVDDLIAVAKKESAGDEEPFTDEDADILRKLYNSSFTVAWDKAGEGVTDDKALINATIDGVTGAEVRVVDQVAYLKIPVKDLATKFGATAADVDEMAAEASAEVPGVEKLVEGGWVSIAAADLEKFTSEAGFNVTPSASSQAENDKVAAELKTSAENLLNGADVVRDAADSTHLTVTTTTTKAFAEVKRFVEALEKIATKDQASILDEAIGSELDTPPAEKPIVLDLWIDNGKFKAFEVNYLQFVDGATGRASVRVEISTGAEITAPTDATKLDLAPIFEAFGGLGGAGLGTGGEGGNDAKVWAELVGQQAVLSALAQGGKPAKYLKQAADETAFGDIKIKVVRTGVAQVNSGASVACVTVPATTSGKPKVVEAAC